MISGDSAEFTWTIEGFHYIGSSGGRAFAFIFRPLKRRTPLLDPQLRVPLYLRYLPDVIFEKFKGPCGHDNPSFGAFAPNHFAGCHFWEICGPLRAWQPVARGFCPKSFLPDVIFEKFKGPCGHDNPSFGAFAPNHFCRMPFLRNLEAPAGMTTRRSELLPQTIFAGCHFWGI